MFSPIVHENLDRAHWPDGKAHNANIALYAKAMEEVCKAKGVTYVDLFTPTREACEKIKEPLTTDGIHPNARGDREISRIIDEALFGGPRAPTPRASTGSRRPSPTRTSSGSTATGSPTATRPTAAAPG
jgi:hypothetical protein